jgi:hypothetical protein
MSPEDQVEIAGAMREARAKARGYADFFGWGANRDLEEWGVVASLFESMEKDGALPYTDLRIRGRGDDPPDCEALTATGQRAAIEVAELVDEEAIKAAKAGRVYEAAEWPKAKFLSNLSELLKRKDSKYPKLLEPPYDGGYTVVVFTDEPVLSAELVAQYLDGETFADIEHITEALFLVSYDPASKCCPYYRLRVGA